jgi:hypothetical protein
VWNTLQGIERVELSMNLSGDIDSPSIAIESNIGSAVAESLQRELGDRIEEAEARLRAELDERVQPLVQEARSRVATVQEEVVGVIAAQRQEIDGLRERIESRIEELAASSLPGGLPRIPGLGN